MAQPNQLNPVVQRVGIKGGSTTHGVFITSGTSTDSATIIVELGTPGTTHDYGTQYICSTTGTVFVSMPTGAFQKITTA